VCASMYVCIYKYIPRKGRIVRLLLYCVCVFVSIHIHIPINFFNQPKPSFCGKLSVSMCEWMCVYIYAYMPASYNLKAPNRYLKGPNPFGKNDM
jgi:hypothetical protein